MKKTLLSLVAIAFAMTSYAQTFDGLDETGFTQRWNTTPANDCSSNGAITGVGNLDNNGFTCTNFQTAPSFNATEPAFQLSSGTLADLTPGGACDGYTRASWMGFRYTNSSNQCAYMRDIGGVDMSGTGHGKFSFVAKASNNGALLRFYVGTIGSTGWVPTSSTWTANIIAEFTLTTDYAVYTYDFETQATTAWAGWAGKTNVNVWGIDPQTASTDYFIQRIDIGSNVTSTTSVDNNAIGIYPNPATTEVKVDFLGMDQNGATAKLINSNGIVVFEGAISNTFSVAGYNKGIYMLQVTSGNKVASKKLVIQ